jgi:hypothetical protein
MPAFHDIPMLADAGWIKLVFVVVFFLIWIFNNLIGDQAKARKARGAGRAAQPRPPQVPEGDRPPAKQQLVGEIEEFLQRANRKRREKQEKSNRKQAVKGEKSAPPPVKKPVRRLAQLSSDNQESPAESAVALSESVRQHLDTSNFAARASSLNDDDIARNDAVRAAHLKEVFGHQLGRLSDTSTPGAAADPPAPPAGAAITPLAALLANPQSLKQAIVLQEILNRREF